MKLKTIKWLNLQKEGIIIGAIVAGIIYYFNIAIPYLVIEEIGIQRLFILMAIFTIGGALIDSWWKPNK